MTWTAQNFVDAICWKTQDEIDNPETLRVFAEMIAEIRSEEHAQWRDVKIMCPTCKEIFKPFCEGAFVPFCSNECRGEAP